MGLYRNIAGFLDPSLIVTPGSTATLPIPFGDPVAWQQQRDDAAAAYRAEMIARYDWLLAHPLSEVTAAGYYVTPDNGGIFKWTDAAHTTSVSHLSLDWIQQIENERGTAGTLLMHLQQPELAKDTAGYEGGSSGTFYEESGADPTTHQVTNPITEVENLPPINGSNGIPTHVPATAPINLSTLKENILPLAVLAGTLIVAIAGETLIPQRSRIVFLGGVGALFYLMAKKK